MKALIIGLCLFSLQAMAHPQAEDSIQQIPIHSKIIFIRDINILPNTAETLIVQSQVGYPKCYLRPAAQSKNDRIIRAGKTYEITSVTIGYNDSKSEMVSRLTLAAPTFEFLVYCKRPLDIGPITIGELQKTYEGTAIISLAAPVEF